MTNNTPRKAILLALMLLMSALTAQMMIAGSVGASDSPEDDGMEFDEIDEIDDEDFEDFEDWTDRNETEYIQMELEYLKEFASELEAEGVDVTELREKISEAEKLWNSELSEEKIEEIWEKLEEAWDAVEWDEFEWEYEDDLTDEEKISFYNEEREYLESDLEDLIERAEGLEVVLYDIDLILGNGDVEISLENFTELDTLFMNAWILAADDVYDDLDDWDEFDNETLIELYTENLSYAKEYIESIKEDGEETTEFEAILARVETLIEEAEAAINDPDIFDEKISEINDLLDEVYEIEYDECWDCYDGEDYEFSSEDLLAWYEQDLEYLKEISVDLSNAGVDNSEIESAIATLQGLVDQANTEAPAIKEETISKIEKVMEEAFGSVDWDELFDDDYIVEYSAEDILGMYRDNLESIKMLRDDVAAQGKDIEELDEVIEDYQEILDEATKAVNSEGVDAFEEYVEDLEELLEDAWEEIDWEDFDPEMELETV